MTDVKVDRYAVEPGIRPLVEAANASGYPTISSCEGHPDGRKAAVVFLASNDEALRTHLGLKRYPCWTSFAVGNCTHGFCTQPTSGFWLGSWRTGA